VSFEAKPVRQHTKEIEPKQFACTLAPSLKTRSLKKRALLLFALGWLLAFKSFAQAPYEGVDFWFSYNQNYEVTSLCSNLKLSIYAEQNSLITLEAPIANWTNSLFVAAGTMVTVNVPSSAGYCYGNTGVYGKGIHLTASTPITASVFNNCMNASEDATLLFPVSMLGNDYLAVSWNDQNQLAEAIAVATEDNTTLEVTPPGGATTSVMLDAGEVYKYQIFAGDVTGTRIVSVCDASGYAAPIAVFSGNPFTNLSQTNSDRDIAMEQLMPVTSWGTHFQVPEIPCHPEFRVLIIANENGTQVITGGIAVSLNAGQSAILSTYTERWVIADKPIAVFAFTYGGDAFPGNCDANPMLIGVSPSEQGIQRGRFITFDNPFVPRYMDVTILTESTNTGGVTFNGAPVTSWTPMAVPPGYPAHSFSKIDLPAGSTDYLIDAGNGTFTAIYTAHIHAYSNGYGIGFQVNFDPFEIGYLGDTLPAPQWTDTLCACEPITFIGPDPNMTYLWDFGDGTTATDNAVSHQYSNGSFTVTMSEPNGQGCFSQTHQHTLEIVNCDISMQPSTPICTGDSVVLTVTAPSATTFLWSTGATTNSITVTPNTTTNYSVQVNGGSLSLCDTITVYVVPAPALNIPPTVSLCRGDSYVLSTGISNAAHVWSTGSNADSIVIAAGGTYSVLVDNGQCSVSDTTLVLETPYPSPPALDSIEYCIGLSNLLDAGNAGSTYLWNTGATTQTIEVMEVGTYTATIASPAGCTNTASFVVEECSIELFIPNAITPNADGDNDVWIIENIDSYPDNRVMVFNRNGQKLFDEDDYANNWAGTWHGQQLPAGAYFYVVDIGNDRMYKGTIHIILEP